MIQPRVVLKEVLRRRCLGRRVVQRIASSSPYCMSALFAPAAAAWPPAILDIEASGFGRDSYPIEVGLVLPDGQSWCSLIRPLPHWQHWNPEAAAMHGITREALLKHGRPVETICLALNEWLGARVAYSDAWAHDYSWLNQIYDAADSVPRFRLENLRALLDDDEAARWHALKQQVCGEARLLRHRASSDAKLLQLTLSRLRKSSAAPVGGVLRAAAIKGL